MAGADYFLCDLCGIKMFYDANVDWEEYRGRIGRLVGICVDCSKTHRIAVTKGVNKIDIQPKFYESYYKAKRKA
jgi:transcription elongation factor Elf1